MGTIVVAHMFIFHWYLIPAHTWWGPTLASASVLAMLSLSRQFHCACEEQMHYHHSTIHTTTSCTDPRFGSAELFEWVRKQRYNHSKRFACHFCVPKTIISKTLDRIHVYSNSQACKWCVNGYRYTKRRGCACKCYKLPKPHYQLRPHLFLLLGISRCSLGLSLRLPLRMSRHG